MNINTEEGIISLLNNLLEAKVKDLELLEVPSIVPGENKHTDTAVLLKKNEISTMKQNIIIISAFIKNSVHAP